MIRITSSQGHARQLLVEGDLIGRYVDELRAACEPLLAGRGGLVLDLSGVRYLDAGASALLDELAERGVQLAGGSTFVRAVLRGIQARSLAQSRAASTGEQLVAGLRQGDEDAREELVRRFGPSMLAVARRLVRDDAEAADVLHAAFWRAFDSAAELASSTILQDWLHRQVVEAALSLRTPREEDARPVDELLPRFAADGTRLRDEADETLALEGPGAHLEDLEPELQELVRATVERLPDPERPVLLLCDVEGFGIDEAASLLGRAPDDLRRTLHRARQALRLALGRALAGRHAWEPVGPSAA